MSGPREWVFPLRESAQDLRADWFRCCGCDRCVANVAAAAAEVLLSSKGMVPEHVSAILSEWGLDSQLHPLLVEEEQSGADWFPV